MAWYTGSSTSGMLRQAWVCEVAHCNPCSGGTLPPPTHYANLNWPGFSDLNGTSNPPPWTAQQTASLAAGGPGSGYIDQVLLELDSTTAGTTNYLFASVYRTTAGPTNIPASSVNMSIEFDLNGSSIFSQSGAAALQGDGKTWLYTITGWTDAGPDGTGGELFTLAYNSLGRWMTGTDVLTCTVGYTPTFSFDSTGVNRGFWNVSTNYVPTDIVRDPNNFSWYQCILANINKEPPNATYWNLAYNTYTMSDPTSMAVLLTTQVGQT